MNNNVFIIGRLNQNPTMEKLEELDNKEGCKITLSVVREYKNEEGIYETDFIDVILTNNMALSTIKYCHKCDLIGIKGRLQTKVYKTKEGDKVYSDITKKLTFIIADKVTFVSNKKK